MEPQWIHHIHHLSQPPPPPIIRVIQRREDHQEGPRNLQQQYQHQRLQQPLPSSNNYQQMNYPPNYCDPGYLYQQQQLQQQQQYFNYLRFCNNNGMISDSRGGGQGSGGGNGEALLFNGGNGGTPLNGSQQHYNNNNIGLFPHPPPPQSDVGRSLSDRRGGQGGGALLFNGNGGGGLNGSQHHIFVHPPPPTKSNDGGRSLIPPPYNNNNNPQSRNNGIAHCVNGSAPFQCIPPPKYLTSQQPATEESVSPDCVPPPIKEVLKRDEVLTGKSPFMGTLSINPFPPPLVQVNQNNHASRGGNPVYPPTQRNIIIQNPPPEELHFVDLTQENVQPSTSSNSSSTTSTEPAQEDELYLRFCNDNGRMSDRGDGIGGALLFNGNGATLNGSQQHYNHNNIGLFDHQPPPQSDVGGSLNDRGDGHRGGALLINGNVEGTLNGSQHHIFVHPPQYNDVGRSFIPPSNNSQSRNNGLSSCVQGVDKSDKLQKNTHCLNGSAPFQFIPTSQPGTSSRPESVSPPDCAPPPINQVVLKRDPEEMEAVLTGKSPFMMTVSINPPPPPPLLQVNQNSKKMDPVYPPTQRKTTPPPPSFVSRFTRSDPTPEELHPDNFVDLIQEDVQPSTSTSTSSTTAEEPAQEEDEPFYLGPKLHVAPGLSTFYGNPRRPKEPSWRDQMRPSPSSSTTSLVPASSRLTDVQSLSLNGTEISSPTTNPAVVLVYIDNSNIYINAQYYACTELKFKSGVHKDPRVRLAVKKLLKKVAQGRKVLQARLYGSEPPPMASVWKKITSLGIHVTRYRRSRDGGKEKGIDTALTVDAVSDIYEYKSFAKGNSNSSVILFTGDGDMQPLVRCAVKHGWNVEIWSFGSSLSKELREEAANSDRIQFHDLAEIFREIVFWNYNWEHNARFPKDKTIILEFEGRDDTKKSRKENVMILCSQIFKVPTTGRYLNRKGGVSIHNKILAVIPILPYDGGDGQDFSHQIWSKMDDLLVELELLNYGCVAHNTFVDWRQQQQNNNGMMDGNVNVQLEDPENNQYEQLYVEDEEEDDDDEEDDGQYEDLGFREPSIAMSDDDDHDDKGYTVVSSKLRPKTQLYSEPCKYSFRCFEGKKCIFAHTEEENAYFKRESNRESRWRYKSQECRLYLKGCEFTDKPHLCSYAHGRTEATCGKCKVQRDHYTNECTNEYKQSQL